MKAQLDIDRGQKPSGANEVRKYIEAALRAVLGGRPRRAAAFAEAAAKLVQERLDGRATP